MIYLPSLIDLILFVFRLLQESSTSWVIYKSIWRQHYPLINTMQLKQSDFGTWLRVDCTTCDGLVLIVFSVLQNSFVPHVLCDAQKSFKSGTDLASRYIPCLFDANMRRISSIQRNERWYGCVANYFNVSWERMKCVTSSWCSEWLMVGVRLPLFSCRFDAQLVVSRQWSFGSQWGVHYRS